MYKTITADLFNSIDDLELFVAHIDPDSYLARVSLEYLVINGKSDLLEKLMEKLLMSSNEESREWAEVYLIDHLVYKQEKDIIDVTKQLTYKRVQSKELSTLIKVFQLYNYYDMKNFEMRTSLGELVKVEIPNLQDGFMKTSLLCRQKLIMQAIHLHQNELEQSRACGKELLEIALTPLMKAIAYNNLGNSYILSDRKQALKHFEASIQIAQLIQHTRILTQAQMNRNFTLCYWNESEKVNLNLDYETRMDEKLELVFYLIKKNQREKALVVLDEVKAGIGNDYVHGFEQYYRGLATGEHLYFQKSSKYFELAGDYYFQQLPLEQLNNGGRR
ncbi:AimR family lysis-lysogeny pheromone receptor [Halalkalibacter krulwichiae]|uniref:Tetratricopeptide repeat protein n=1 Tax=Halalkalibacter krulwichiae TaxID=199441 RepID=A0A1X9MGV7_9BACI|nr:AimR family lysis-lysogeny pheromone receptor [Halalkalibacter krulwichiae]ARK30741.1 hypothetical protein BkAM31D_13370 [Halalkalibacter krulwichiae]